MYVCECEGVCVCVWVSDMCGVQLKKTSKVEDDAVD